MGNAYKPFAPMPHVVRQKYSHFKRLKEIYEQRLASNSFNISGKGSRTYYERAIRGYEMYFFKWSHLLEINLKTQKKELTV